MKLKPFLLINLLLLIFACSNESVDNEDDDDGGNEDAVLIKQINYSIVDEDEESYTEVFNYDGNRLLSIIDTYNDSDDEYKSTFEYANDKLIRINNFEDNELMEYVTFAYDTQGLLTSLTTYTFDIDGENVAIRSDLNYNTNNLSFSTENYRGDFSSQTEYVGATNYSVTNGDISEINYENSDDTLQFQYDTKNSIFKNIFEIRIIIIAFENTEYGFDIYGANNNVTQKIDNQGDFIDTETASYTYNSNDYPNTAMYFYDGELDSNIEFIYE